MNRTPSLLLFVIGAALLMCSGAASAQLKVDVGLVNVVATVTDSRNHYVEGLTAADFVVKEDGEPQKITHFEQSRNVPISMGILLDTSRSMEPRIKAATEAVSRFLRSIHKDDDVFLVTFDRTPTLRQDFTSNRDKLESAMKKAKLGSGTAIYDAIDMSLTKVKEGKYDNRALLLVTDGEDMSSRLSESEIVDRVKQSGVLIYALGIGAETSRLTSTHPPGRGPTGPPIGPSRGGRGGRGGITLPGGITIPIPGGRRLTASQFPGQGGRYPGRDAVNMNVLKSLAAASGGRAWLVSADTKSRAVQDALDEIADELRNQYNIGYYPGHPLNDGKWHHVEVYTKGDKYDVRARDEYFGQ